MKFYAPKYKQLDLGLLRSSLDELDKKNRWVALGDLLPWTELEREYNSRLDNQKQGAGNKPARMILGAMIIKHKLNLSDAETIEIIRESPYMQYFCGLHEFTDKPIFFFASSSSRLRFSSRRRFCLSRSLTVILFSSSSEIRLRIVTNRLGSNIGLSVNPCKPQKYCM